MGWTDFFKAKPAAAPVLPKLAAVPDVRGNPGTRIYHEYFVDEAPINGRYHWLCRVYAADGLPHQTTGSEESDHEARMAAITWASTTKAALRGAA